MPETTPYLVEGIGQDLELPPPDVGREQEGEVQLGERELVGEPRHLRARLETFKQRCAETFSWQRVARSLLAAASSLAATARLGTNVVN